MSLTSLLHSHKQVRGVHVSHAFFLLSHGGWSLRVLTVGRPLYLGRYHPGYGRSDGCGGSWRARTRIEDQLVQGRVSCALVGALALWMTIAMLGAARRGQHAGAAGRLLAVVERLYVTPHGFFTSLSGSCLYDSFYLVFIVDLKLVNLARDVS